MNPIVSELKERLRQQRDLLNELQSTRLHRALSWLAAAEQQQDDADLRFICGWISFSACCFVEEDYSAPLEQQQAFRRFVEQLVALDTDEKIYHCLWHQFSGPVRALIKNPYVFAPFWLSQRAGNDDWKPQFDLSSVAAERIESQESRRITGHCSGSLIGAAQSGCAWRCDLSEPG